MLASGTRLGPYEIVAPIGAGGMGEVFRARDTRLDRSVAIKILPAEFAQDAQLKIRLEREAKTISQLNHPHICTLFDVGHDNGTDYLVMEYIEGESLADRLAKGPLPLDQLLRYAIEIADALDKAHRKGIVHRDLKPGNIMIAKSGAKLLDFGLAKSNRAAISDGSGVTAQKPLTSEGTIVGTFQYMAPEQLEGAEADARTDIFAFGAVLYEMATGRRAFEGKTKTSLIAAIVGGEPKPISQLQPLTPASLETAIKRCLNKDPDDRWQYATDLRWDLLRIQEEVATDKRAPSRNSRLAWSIAAVALLAGIVLAVIAFRPAAPAPVIRFTAAPPIGWAFSMDYGVGPPAVSPDGKYVAFSATDTATGRLLLWVRDFASTEPVALPGTDGAGFAFWSPDSRSLAFFAGGFLKRVDLSGGSPRVLVPSAVGRGGSWSKENEIIFAPTGNGAIHRVRADGGVSRPLTHLDTANHEASHRWPLFLPDGKHFLYLGRRPWTAEALGDSIYVASLDAPQGRPILNVSSNIGYADPGYLLFLRDRTLMAQRLNLRTLQMEGEPRPIIREPLPYHPSGFGLFSCSRNGVLAYGTAGVPARLQWADRNGHLEPAIFEGDNTTPRLSADGRQIVHSRPDAATGNQDVWLYDLTRNLSRRVTFHPRDDFDGVLTPDGNTLIFASNRRGFPDLYMKTVEGRDETLLLGTAQAAFPSGVSPDGHTVVFRRLSPETLNDVCTLDLDSRKATPFAATQFSEIQPIFAPSGRWIAWASNETGKYEVYASRYPGNTSRVQISTEGGTQPTWRGDEKEMFYVAAGDRIMSVPIEIANGVLKPGTPRTVVEVALRPSRNDQKEYDVTRDGRRFIVNSIPPDKRSLPITVVFNWLTEFERK